MKSERTRAVVLRRTNYGEADRIVQFLTPIGRRSVIARGVRREKSKLAGGIELFAVSDIVIGQGKGDLGVLTGARLVHFYRHIIEDYDRMQFGYEALKQVTKHIGKARGRLVLRQCERKLRIHECYLGALCVVWISRLKPQFSI